MDMPAAAVGHIWGSFFSPAYYRRLKHQSWIKSLLVVGVIAMAISAYQTYDLAQSFEGGVLSVVLDLVSSFPEDLVITLRDGKLSTNADLPLIVPWPQSWQSFVDRWGIVPHMAAFESSATVNRQRSGTMAYIIFTEDGIYVDQNVLQTNIMHQPYYFQAYEDAEIDGQGLGDTTITRDILMAVSQELVHDLEEAIGESIDTSLLIIVSCIVIWAVTVTLTVYVFINSVVGFLVFTIVSSNRDFTYGDVVKITLHAQVPIWVATGLLSNAVGGLDFVLDIAFEASLLLAILHATLTDAGERVGEEEEDYEREDGVHDGEERERMVDIRHQELTTRLLLETEQLRMKVEEAERRMEAMKQRGPFRDPQRNARHDPEVE